MAWGKETPGQPVDALVDDQQDKEGGKEQKKLPAEEKVAARGDAGAVEPGGKGQKGEHDQDGQGVGLYDADEKIFPGVAGPGHFGADGLEGGFALLLGRGELAFTAGHGMKPPA